MRAAVMHSAEKALSLSLAVRVCLLFFLFIFKQTQHKGFAPSARAETLLRALLITPGRLHYGGARSGSEQVATGPSERQTKGHPGRVHRIV